MKVKLIADSGSTKADWKLIRDNSEPVSFQTRGMNPYFRTAGDISAEMEEKVVPFAGRVDAVYFYGAGITQRENIVQETLLQLFPGAVVETHSDVLGASRALFGREAGIACTLGTGSNACYYDGNEVAEKVPPLGFILGDECSGSAFGKKLLGDYFKQIMPPSLRKMFEDEFSPALADVLDHVYRIERPNRYLASFAPFLSAHMEEDYCRKMVEESFDEFFRRNVLTLSVANNHEVRFTGSVAFYFSEIFSRRTEAFGFKRPFILKEPVTGLVTYHKNL